MLPGMGRKPHIAIVGPGNLGTSLASSLKEAGYTVDAIISRPEKKSLARARKLASRIGARVFSSLDKVQSKIVWFCVPDSEIAKVAASLASTFQGKGRVALHSSGALASDELAALRKKGAVVASVHPLMTFVRGSRPSLSGVSFAIEGNAAAVKISRRIVRDLGGHAYLIKKKQKAAYHAWGAFTSPLLTALLAMGEEVAVLAGVKRKAARKRAIPILQQTLANYASFGAPGAFSGPIVRGDVETVRKHLEVLREMPTARRSYLALAEAATQYLPTKKKAVLRRLLSGLEA